MPCEVHANKLITIKDLIGHGLIPFTEGWSAFLPALGRSGGCGGG